MSKYKDYFANIFFMLQLTRKVAWVFLRFVDFNNEKNVVGVLVEFSHFIPEEIETWKSVENWSSHERQPAFQQKHFRAAFRHKPTCVIFDMIPRLCKTIFSYVNYKC